MLCLNESVKNQVIRVQKKFNVKIFLILQSIISAGIRSVYMVDAA